MTFIPGSYQSDILLNSYYHYSNEESIYSNNDNIKLPLGPCKNDQVPCHNQPSVFYSQRDYNHKNVSNAKKNI